MGVNTSYVGLVMECEHINLDYAVRDRKQQYPARQASQTLYLMPLLIKTEVCRRRQYDL